MDLPDEELTRKAIEEILRETNEHKERDEIRPNERKVNPLRKPNKCFLGRTLNAMIKHNTRTDEKNRLRCHKKLRELNKRHKSSKSESSDVSCKRRNKRKLRDSSNDSSESEGRSKFKSKRRKKHKRERKRGRRESSSSSESSPKRYKKSTNDEEPWQSNESSQTINGESAYGTTNSEFPPNYVDSISHWMLPPAFWPAPLQQLMQYNALMAFGGAIQSNATKNVQIDELSLSSSTLSDVNFDEVESKHSANEIDTIDVSTDDEKSPRKNGRSKRNDTASEIDTIEVDNTDSDDASESCCVIEVTESDSDERTNKQAAESISLVDSDVDDLAEVTSKRSAESTCVVELTDSDADDVPEKTSKQSTESASVVELIESDADDMPESISKQSAESSSVKEIPKSDADNLPERTSKESAESTCVVELTVPEPDEILKRAIKQSPAND